MNRSQSASPAEPVTSNRPPAAHGRVSFRRVLAMEWVKFVSLRSTVWTLVATMLVMVGLSTLIAFLWADGSAWSSELGIRVLTESHTFAQLVAAVLGVLVMGTEYSTGLIRTTLLAVPTRTPVLAAKALVVGGSVFLVTTAAVLVSYLVTLPLLRPLGGAADLADGETLRRLLGMGLFLAAVALLGLGITALVRNTAAGLAVVLGVVLLAPMLVPLLGNFLPGDLQLAIFLPTTAGALIMAPTLSAADFPAGTIVLGPWEGLGVLLLWVALTLTAAVLVLRRRDA